VKELSASELFWLLRHKDKRIMPAPETAPGLLAPIRKKQIIMRVRRTQKKCNFSDILLLVKFSINDAVQTAEPGVGGGVNIQSFR
jgi:hypothetical protein